MEWLKLKFASCVILNLFSKKEKGSAAKGRVLVLFDRVELEGTKQGCSVVRYVPR